MKFSDFYIEKQYFSEKKKQDNKFISTTGTRHYIKKSSIQSVIQIIFMGIIKIFLNYILTIFYHLFREIFIIYIVSSARVSTIFY